MTFHEEIANIKAGITHSGTGDTTSPAAGPLTRTREARRMFDALNDQFDAQIGQSVICLPVAHDYEKRELTK